MKIKPGIYVELEWDYEPHFEAITGHITKAEALNEFIVKQKLWNELPDGWKIYHGYLVSKLEENRIDSIVYTTERLNRWSYPATIATNKPENGWKEIYLDWVESKEFEGKYHIVEEVHSLHMNYAIANNFDKALNQEFALSWVFGDMKYIETCEHKPCKYIMESNPLNWVTTVYMPIKHSQWKVKW
ncbi:MAG: hypothetical protein WC783_02965 [Candidatus Paceibacterota bacterium]|jgi:hypothetical protein